MKVLWFSLSPCGSIRRSNKQRVIQGWMISLEDAVKSKCDIELSVAFFSPIEEPPFFYEGVRYYPMYLPKPQNPLLRVFDRTRNPKTVDDKMLPVMLSVVNESAPDLIHIHGTEERFGLIAEYVKEIPIVYSIQGLLAPYSEKYFAGFPYSSVMRCESFYDKIRKVSVKDEYNIFCYRAKRELTFLRSARYIFGRTFWDEYITSAINPERKYFIVNEILRNEFYTKKWEKESFRVGPVRIISTISNGIYKGYETVLKTAYILRTYSKLNFVWYIAGYDKNIKWVKIAGKMTGMDYDKLGICLLGRLDSSELSDYLVKSDIYCQVSHIENSPNSLCEAMLVGMPIVATYAGGTSSLLENMQEGILVQDGDPYVLAGAIRSMINNYSRAKSFGQNARNRALFRHDKDRIVEELISAYQAVMLDYHQEGEAI